jgi:hypothetical protein
MERDRQLTLGQHCQTCRCPRRTVGDKRHTFDTGSPAQARDEVEKRNGERLEDEDKEGKGPVKAGGEVTGARGMAEERVRDRADGVTERDPGREPQGDLRGEEPRETDVCSDGDGGLASISTGSSLESDPDPTDGLMLDDSGNTQCLLAATGRFAYTYTVTKSGTLNTSLPSLTSDRPSEECADWLMAEAYARGISLPPNITAWIEYAKEATMQRAVQTLQAWLQTARQHLGTESMSQLELPEPISREASLVLDRRVESRDLALAEKIFKSCERVQTLGGQAVLCQRLGYANLYRLNKRAKEQSDRKWGFREALFYRCYPEFGPCRNLQTISGAARTALNRLSRNIHFGGTLCRFADHGPTPEGLLLLQPTIPDSFLRKLTAPHMDLWAEMVYRSANLSSGTLYCLWRAMSMIVNRSINLRSYRFPLEHVRVDGSKYIDLQTDCAFRGSIEDLLTPVLIDLPTLRFVDGDCNRAWLENCQPAAESPGSARLDVPSSHLVVTPK